MVVFAEGVTNSFKTYSQQDPADKVLDVSVAPCGKTVAKIGVKTIELYCFNFQFNNWQQVAALRVRPIDELNRTELEQPSSDDKVKESERVTTLWKRDGSKFAVLITFLKRTSDSSGPETVGFCLDVYDVLEIQSDGPSRRQAEGVNNRIQSRDGAVEDDGRSTRLELDKWKDIAPTSIVEVPEWYPKTMLNASKIVDISGAVNDLTVLHVARLTPSSLTQFGKARKSLMEIAAASEILISSICLSRNFILAGSTRGSLIPILWSGECIFEQEKKLAYEAEAADATEKDSTHQVAVNCLSLGFNRNVCGYVLSTGQAGCCLNLLTTQKSGVSHVFQGEYAFLNFIRFEDVGLQQESQATTEMLGTQQVRLLNCATISMHPKKRLFLIGMDNGAAGDVFMYAYHFLQAEVAVEGFQQKPVNIVVDCVRRIELKSIDLFPRRTSVTALRWCPVVSATASDTFITVYEHAGFVVWGTSGCKLLSVMSQVRFDIALYLH